MQSAGDSDHSGRACRDGAQGRCVSRKRRCWKTSLSLASFVETIVTIVGRGRRRRACAATGHVMPERGLFRSSCSERPGLACRTELRSASAAVRGRYNAAIQSDHRMLDLLKTPHAVGSGRHGDARERASSDHRDSHARQGPPRPVVELDAALRTPIRRISSTPFPRLPRGRGACYGPRVGARRLFSKVCTYRT